MWVRREKLRNRLIRGEGESPYSRPNVLSVIRRKKEGIEETEIADG